MRGFTVLSVLLLTASCVGHAIHKRDAFFQEVVRQRTLGNTGITQCPCVMHPESRQCIAYDSRIQAATVEEAILTFPDLTRDSFYPSPVTSATFACQTLGCQHCFGLLYYRLLDVGFLTAGFRPHTPVLPRNQLNYNYCPKFHFPVPPVVPPPPLVPDFVRRLISDGMRYMQSGALFAPPRQFMNRDRFRPGPAATNQRNQQQQQARTQWQQQRPQQPQQRPQQQQWQQPQQRPQQQQWQQQRQQQVPQQRPQQPQQWQQQPQPRPQWQQPVRPQPLPPIPSPWVWNAAIRRWEHQPQFPGITPRPNPLIQQGRQWTQQQWNQATQNGQNWQPQQWTQQQSQVQTQQQVQVQQPQWNQQVQQPQWSQQVQQPQLQATQQTQWQQPQWSQQQWSPQQEWPQQGQWSQPDVQQSVAQQALGHQAINTLTQQMPSFGQPQGSQGQGQGQPAPSFQAAPVVGSVLGGLLGRKKRAAPDPLVGRRFDIACVKRGETTADTGEFLSLCGTCWTWRELPADYFPRILNELSCQEGDYCLSGWGQCQQQFRNVDVLRKVDGRWVPTVITTATCCDCRVKAGSVVHALVVGDRQSKE